MIAATEALARLRAGNQRFVSNRMQRVSDSHRPDLASGQFPFAIILGCSDSRVPAELVFDQGLGDLFVIRVAGNIVAPSQVGSVEFAASRYATNLVVVVGHTQCGAILATIEELTGQASSESENQRSIVDMVRPAVETVLDDQRDEPLPKLISRAVRANVRASANHLRHGSRLLERLMRERGLLVVGAEYSLETGIVDFFDGMPR